MKLTREFIIGTVRSGGSPEEVADAILAEMERKPVPKNPKPVPKCSRCGKEHDRDAVRQAHGESSQVYQRFLCSEECLSEELSDTRFGTFQGKAVRIGDIDHQHLSNMHWYNLIIMERKPTAPVQNELKKRFNGEILPYSPNLDFTSEIQTLESRGYLRWVREKAVTPGIPAEHAPEQVVGIITFRGEEVGRISHTKLVSHNLGI